MLLKCDQTYGAENRELLKLDVLIALLSTVGFGCHAKGVQGALENLHEPGLALAIVQGGVLL